MSFITSEDRQKMERIYSQPTYKLNALEAENSLIRFPEVYKSENRMFSKILETLEKFILEQQIPITNFGIRSFDEVNTGKKFTAHFKKDYDLLNRLESFLKRPQDEISELGDLYKKYEIQHDCLKQVFIPIKTWVV